MACMLGILMQRRGLFLNRREKDENEKKTIDERFYL